jgi:hypothetical protein
MRLFVKFVNREVTVYPKSLTNRRGGLERVRELETNVREREREVKI